MHIYATVLEKGGCGKSALSVNTAACFQQLGLRTLLIDLDSQASATHWLGINPDELRPEDSLLGILNDGLTNEVSASSILSRVHQTAEGIFVLPAHPLMASLPAQLPMLPVGGLFLLKQALAEVARSDHPFDIVVLDLPPARGPIQATALACATRCLTPVQPEDLVIRALQALILSTQQIQTTGVNSDLKLSIVRNKYAPRSNADKVFDQLLHSHYAGLLMHTIFPNRAALRDSAALQQTVFRYVGPDAVEVRALFLQLAEELIALDGEV